MRKRTADDRRSSERKEQERLSEKSAGCGGVAGESEITRESGAAS